MRLTAIVCWSQRLASLRSNGCSCLVFVPSAIVKVILHVVSLALRHQSVGGCGLGFKVAIPATKLCELVFVPSCFVRFVVCLSYCSISEHRTAQHSIAQQRTLTPFLRLRA